MDPILLQQQVRENAEDLRNYMQDLKSWESEMKRKETEIHSADSSNQDHPPIRSKIKKLSKGKSKCETEKEKPTKISGLDYASWDKFDVDKACEAIDSEEQRDSEDDDDDAVNEIEEERRREEAMYEKERGNNFVKSRKWKEAIQCYNRAIKCYPHEAIFYANRALCYLKIQELKSAEADCTTAIQLDSNYVKAYQRRAMARAGLAQFAEARADLLRVMEIEPKNAASRAELSKIEKKLNLKTEQITVKSSRQSKSSEAEEDSTEKSLKLPTSNSEINKITEEESKEKKPQNLQKGVSCTSNNESSTEKEFEKQAKCTVNSEILELQNVDSRSRTNKIQEVKLWPDEEEVTLIQPIQKPPHLRSKKPLKQISIKEVDNSSSIQNTVVHEISEVPEDSKVEDKPDKKESPFTVEHQKGDGISRHGDIESKTIESEERTKTQNRVIEPTTNLQPEKDIDQIPPPPSTAVQFYIEWRKVRSNPQLSYLYLKQIPGSEIPNLFQDSLESSTLSDIITTLEKSFLQSKEPVLPYIIGLTKVRRFSALIMFLSDADKAGIKKILEYCNVQGECTPDDFTELKKKYEL